MPRQAADLKYSFSSHSLSSAAPGLNLGASQPPYPRQQHGPAAVLVQLHNLFSIIFLINLISCVVQGGEQRPRRQPHHSFISQGGGRDIAFANIHPVQPASKYMDLHLEGDIFCKNIFIILFCKNIFIMLILVYTSGKRGQDHQRINGKVKRG